jgi:nucleoside-diphosphate-sugar epimerase
VKAFVTGATGFVGSHLAEALARRGDDVIALARRPEAHEAVRALGATPVPGSLEDAASLRPALEGVEVVYHVAGAISASGPGEFFAINEGGTRRLLEAAHSVAPSARFVYVSSQAALGPSPRDTPLDEDSTCKPVTAYGKSKLAGERVVQDGALPWAIVRPSSVYGPRDREFLQLFQVVRRGIAPVFGDGTQQLSLVFIEDLVDAIILSGLRPQASGRIYHAAHTEIVLSRDVAREAGRAIGRRPVILPLPGAVAAPIVAMAGTVVRALGRRTVLNRDKMAEFLAPAWLLSSERAFRELGWKAATGVAEGMTATGRWYQEHGWL